MQNKEWFLPLLVLVLSIKTLKCKFLSNENSLKTVRFLPKLPSEASFRIRAVFPFPFGNKANPFRFKGF